MSKPRDRRALAKAKAESMDRFLRDYDDYCAEMEVQKLKPYWVDLTQIDWDKTTTGLDNVQFLLNLETDDDA